jgi:hypothetical protein
MRLTLENRQINSQEGAGVSVLIRHSVHEDRTPGHRLPDRCPLPDHGADITTHHFTKAEQEPFLYAPGELVFGNRRETECFVK